MEKENSKKLGSEICIAMIGIYVYAATILAQYGFLTYFELPSSFIEASIRSNTIFFYNLIKAIVITSPILFLKILLPLFVFVVVLILIFYYLLDYRKIENKNMLPKFISINKNKIINFVWIVVFVWMLHFFYVFGYKLGEIGKSFHSFSNNCSLVNQSENTFIPSFHEDKAIVMYYDQDKKIENKYSIVDITNSDCSIEKKEITNLHK